MIQQPLRNVLGIARVNFLTLTLVCLLLAFAAAQWSFTDLNTALIPWVSVAAFLAHISVNAFNEYFDFRSGLDFKTRKTPFSGGSGTLVQHPAAARMALTLALTSLAGVIASGLYVAWQSTWGLVTLGLIGVFVIYAYTQYLNRSAWLCLLAPGLGFGLLMTIGASWALAANASQFNLWQLPSAIWLCGLMVMLLVNNLLLLNQFPDCEADATVGRRHFPIRIGRRHSAHIFTAQLVLAYGLLLVGVFTKALPIAGLLVVFSALLLPKLLTGVYQHANQPSALVPFLGLNVALIHAFIALLAIALWLAKYVSA